MQYLKLQTTDAIGPFCSVNMQSKSEIAARPYFAETLNA